MSVKPRGAGYEAYVTDSKTGKRRRKTLPTYTEAVKWEAETKLALAAGSDLPRKASVNSWTFETALQKTYDAEWRGTKAEDSAMKNANMVMNFFGKDCSLSVINTERVQDLVNHLRNEVGNSNGTINRKLAALSKILKYAWKCERLDKLPYIPRQKESVTKERFLSLPEEEAIVKTLRQLDRDDIADLVIFQLDTGARIGETLKLTGDACTPKQVTFYDTKNHKDHVVPLTPRVSQIISKRLEVFGDGKIFPGLTYEKIRYEFVRALQINQIDDHAVTIHTLRHTFASRLVQRGVSIQTVSKLMNHSSLQVTMRYAKLAPSNLTDAISVLSNGSVTVA